MQQNDDVFFSTSLILFPSKMIILEKTYKGIPFE